MTFNVGDRVWHKTTGSKQLGTVLSSNEVRTIVNWDIGTHIRNIVGSEGSHGTLFLELSEPSESPYDPTQMGDREDDI